MKYEQLSESVKRKLYNNYKMNATIEGITEDELIQFEEYGVAIAYDGLEFDENGEEI
jgi:hypothetical protein